MSAVDSAKKAKAKQPAHLAKFIERHTTKSLTRKGVYVASTELRLHPFAELLPAMSDADLATLTADIAENGQREPIWITDDGEILDGRHRWRALEELGTGCWCEYVSQRFISGKEELFDFVMSMNLHRRHLSDSQRAMLAAERATLGKGQKKGKGKSAGLPTSTVAEAAAAMQVSPRSVGKAKKVAVKGPKVLKELVQAGKVSVSLAEEAVAVLDKRSIEFLCGPGMKQTPAAALKTAIFETRARNKEDAAWAAKAFGLGEKEEEGNHGDHGGTEENFTPPAPPSAGGASATAGGENTAGTAVPHSSGDTGGELRDLTVAERAWLAEHGYVEQEPNPYTKTKRFDFRRVISKKLWIDLDFSLVDGRGATWIASFQIPGSSVGCGGGTIGFYERIESAGAGIDVRLERMAEEGKREAENRKLHHEGTKGTKENFAPPAPPQAGGKNTAGTAVPHSSGGTGGFDFGYLVELVRDINEVLGDAGDLAVGSPTEAEVRFLVDHLDAAVGKLVEIRDTWNLCLVEEE